MVSESDTEPLSRVFLILAPAEGPGSPCQRLVATAAAAVATGPPLA